MSQASDIADAVAAELNGESFDIAFEAVRRLAPSFEAKDLAEIKVSVVPGSPESSMIARRVRRRDFPVSVVIQKKPNGEDEIDSLSALAEDIEAFLIRRPLAGTPEAQWMEGAVDPLFDMELWRTYRVYFGIVNVLYAVGEKTAQ